MASVTKPPITVVGTNGVNIWQGQGAPTKAAIVAHIMEGTLAGCISWFSNPAAQASSNYGVGKGGRIVQFVDPLGPDAPFANGLVQSPDQTVKNLLAATGTVNLNFVTISIEHEGMSGDALTPAQLDASAHLAAWLCQQFNIPADEDHLVGHYEIDSVTRAHCPGWDRAGWLAWEAAIAAYLQSPPNPSPTPQPDPRDAQLAALQAKIRAAQAALA